MPGNWSYTCNARTGYALEVLRQATIMLKLGNWITMYEVVRRDGVFDQLFEFSYRTDTEQDLKALVLVGDVQFAGKFRIEGREGTHNQSTDGKRTVTVQL